MKICPYSAEEIQDEAKGEIFEERRKATAIGRVLWIILIVLGALGWMFWKWYAFVIALVLAFILGSIYSIITGKKIQQKYELNIHEQDALFKSASYEGFNIEDNIDEREDNNL